MGFFIFNIYSFVFAGVNPPDDIRRKVIQEAFKEQEIILAFKEAALRQSREISTVEANPEPAAFSLPLVAHYYAEWDSRYNDNIFFINNDTKRDLINRLTPGIKLSLAGLDPATSANNNLELDFGVNLYSFRNHPQFNRQKPFVNLSSRFGRGNHRISLDQDFQKNYSAASSYISGDAGFSDYTTNNTKLTWESAYKHFGFEVDCYRWDSEYMGDFKASTLEQQMFAPSVFFQIAPKTRIVLGYNYGWADYTKRTAKANDSSYDRFWVEVDGELSKKISGLVKFGVESRDYKGLPDPRNEPAFKMNLNYKFSPRTIFIFKLAKGNKDPTYIAEAFDKGMDVFVGAGHRIARKLAINLGFDFGKDKYDSGTKNRTAIYSTQLTYSLKKWLSIFFRYIYTVRKSNQPANEYKGNICSLETRAIF